MLTTASPGVFPLTTTQLNDWHDQGFLIVRGAMDPASLTPVREVFEQAVEKQARQWLAAGQITDPCEGLPFEKRYGALREQLPANFSNSWRRILVSPALYGVWRHPVLLGLARALLGDEIMASSTWNGRPRAPHQLKQTIDWHQDAHYCREYDPRDGRIISMWFPFVPVDEKSGCLQVAPGSHKKGYLPFARLERNGLAGLPDEQVAEFPHHSCIMNPGDVLLFTELTIHRSLDNVADYTRWSLDIRYFDARNTEVRRKNPGGYYAFSAADVSRIEPYEAWAKNYEYEGEF